MRAWPVLGFVICTAALSACHSHGPAGDDVGVDSESASIRAEADAWFKAIAAKDLEKTLSFYAVDAQYLSAGRPAATTPEERRRLWVEDFAIPGFYSDEATAAVEVARSKDLAYQRGTYTVSLLNAQGQPEQSTGKFVVVWKKQGDGKWRAVVDIDNADR